MDSYYASSRRVETNQLSGFLTRLCAERGLNFECKQDGATQLNVPCQQNESDCGLCMLQNVEYYFRVRAISTIMYIAGISDTLCLCYCFMCVLYTMAYVWCNDHVNSCLHIDFFIECRPHIRQHIHCTQKVGTFAEQILVGLSGKMYILKPINFW